MNKRRFKLIQALLVAVLVFNIFSPEVLAAGGQQDIPPEVDLLMKLSDFIEQNYAGDVDRLQLIQGALRGMVDSLNDPYSEYFSPEELKEFERSTSGNFGGIGIVITTKDGFTTVVSVLEGSPAARKGIKPGDRIVEIDGKDVTKLTTSEVAELLRGNEGTKVSVGILREGEKQILKFDITREIIRVNPIEYRILEKGIGYIKISEFNENTAENIDKALAAFKNSGVRGLVLDLRNNPGGLLDQAVETARRFVPKGLIVKVISKNGNTRAYYSDSAPSPFKLVVLVNGGSASASEILAGAIKDRKAGVIVGERTFGKATVQQLINLGSLGGIKLTIARYVTPSGIDINETGIVPDIEVKQDTSDPTKDFVPLKSTRPLKYGCIGLDVMGLQQHLRFLGLFNGEPDGVFEQRTKKAVEDFQAKKGFPVNGIADEKLLEALDGAVNEALKSREDLQLKKALEVLKGLLTEKTKRAV
ncbi:S41 family peptidase [Thermosediminibacter oceani]|uniref:Carboxyl-terminal protease n=1 Tax=Thermosediminibacter oceani (strain ATCC BAA-1034 / DSM 16646 / JW/IW-1228P) TaxID=555079 RepID=D9RY49_THEOJ|nr:S41 family peptidase [Thermosediminibacter oceani]ADL08273.1 carboxyl-terminal protease [Thermosediminibacter oceani DSM 16646]